MTATETLMIRVDKLPEDFQQILCDLTMEIVGDEFVVPQIVPCRMIRLASLRKEALEEARKWNRSDFHSALTMVDTLDAGRSLPPLIVRGDSLIDGFHRTFALLFCGREEFAAIDLDLLKREMP